MNAVIQLDPTVPEEQVTAALSEWLRDTRGLELRSADHDGVMVEWRTAKEAPFECQLVASDSQRKTRCAVTVISDDAGAVAIIDATSSAGAEAYHATIDLSPQLQLLLKLLLPAATTLLDLPRGAINDLDAVDGINLTSALGGALVPGLVIAVVPCGGSPSPAQKMLLDALSGLAILGTASPGATILADFGLSTAARVGSIVSISRTGGGLDAQIVASTSLRTKPDSARRLLVRRQLSAPVPFDLERRRSECMTRLLAGDTQIDLPTALQLLDEESRRANEVGNRIKELQTLLDRAYEEQDSALGELDNAQSQVRYLQRAFRELGEIPLVPAGDDEDWLPECSIDALVAARESLPFLFIGTTDRGCALLDEHPKRGIWGKKIWSTLRALNDYCRAKAEGRFRGDLSLYRHDSPDGAIPLLSEYAATESKSTTDDTKLVLLRTFNVPRTVHPSGTVYMEQHVKIDKGGQSAPRIHLYDDSGGSTQRIHIGYIGPHLPTAGGF